MFQTPMEGATSELEIDSELVMSFYDQYQVTYLPWKLSSHYKQKHEQADDLAGKVYGVNTGLASLDDPDSGGTGKEYLTAPELAIITIDM